MSRSKSHVLSAILKYGYSKFSVEILEYCSPEECIKREQHFIDLLNPSYNLKRKAGSSLGYKHGEETLANMSKAKKGEANPMYGKNQITLRKLELGCLIFRKEDQELKDQENLHKK